MDGGVKQSNAARVIDGRDVLVMGTGLFPRGRPWKAVAQSVMGRDMKALIVLGGDAPGVGLLGLRGGGDFSHRGGSR